MRSSSKEVIALFAVLASMAVLLTAPAGLFAGATLISTASMLAAAFWLGGYGRLFAPTAKTLAAGVCSAVLLYFLFLGGNAAVSSLHPFGIGPSAEASIYSLVASPSNPLYLQVLVLAFDAAGYESYFRGVLQKRTEPRLGAAAPFLAAGLDSAMHLLTLNPVWVVATFLVDSVWGLVYYFTKDLTSNLTSHFLWDLLIFLVIPIR